MQTKPTILAALLLILSALCAGTAYAQTIYFSYSCQENCSGGLGVVANGASDSVTIAAVNSDVPGYTQPVPINGGLLNFQTPPAYWWFCDPYTEQCAGYYYPGGSAVITGSVFGLPNGSALLNASFQEAEGGSSDYGEAVQAEIYIPYINPVLLDNLGLHGAPNCGTGQLYDSYSYDFGTKTWTHTVSVTFTPGGCYSYNVLHNFSGGSDGASPVGGLTLDAAGNLYGTAQGGGLGFGTVWKLQHSAEGWIFNPLYQFKGGSDGAEPIAGVTIGADGTLYGATSSGGNQNCSGNFRYSGCGVIFHLKPQPRACTSALCPWTENVLYSFTGQFNGDGANPTGTLIFDQSGSLYGTTQFGGEYEYCGDCGTVFKLAPSGSGWAESVLASFSAIRYAGAHPYAGLTFDQSGNLWGTTFTGDLGFGTMFELTPSGSGWSFNVILEFQGGSSPAGGNPATGVILDSSGNHYGATTGYGPLGGGVVFELEKLADGSPLFAFSLDHGDGPWNLVLDQAGNPFGTTRGGGANNYGAIFELTPNTPGPGGYWAYAPLYDFTGGSDGAYPIGSLVMDRNGNFYGTTSAGGAYGQGVVFQLTPRK